MKLIKKLHFHPKRVKESKEIKQKEEKKPRGHFYGRKWTPEN